MTELEIKRIDYLNYTMKFVCTLLDPKKTPKVPRKVRQTALSCLRQYPEASWADKINKFLKDK